MEPRSAIQRTTTYRSPSGPSRCKVAGSWAAGSGFDEQLAGLLLVRLRVVTLIALLPSLLFLVRNLLEAPSPPPPRQQLALFLHTLVTALMAGLGFLLWQRQAFCLHSLR